MDTRPSFIGNYKDLMEPDNKSFPESDELLSISSPVGKKLGLTKIGIHIETIPPGRRTSWPHAESTEEEFAYVIEGNPHVWIDGNVYELNPGDFVALPAGTGFAHTFINNSIEDCVVLIGEEKMKVENQSFYPLHRKKNEEIHKKGLFWENHPLHEMGPHDALPDLLRIKEETSFK